MSFRFILILYDISFKKKTFRFFLIFVKRVLIFVCKFFFYKSLKCVTFSDSIEIKGCFQCDDCQVVK